MKNLLRTCLSGRQAFFYVILFFLFPVLAKASENSAPKYMWYRDIPKENKDYYVAFRGQLNIISEGDCEIKILGASWFVGWLDGKYFCEGPARFPPPVLPPPPAYLHPSPLLLSGSFLLPYLLNNISPQGIIQ